MLNSRFALEQKPRHTHTGTNSNMSRSSDDNNEMFVDEGPSLFSNQDSIENEDKKSQASSSSLCVSVLCNGSFMSRDSKQDQQQQEKEQSDVVSGLSLAIENKKSYEKKTSSINSKIVAGTYSHLYAISTDANQVFGCSIESDETIRGQSCIIFDKPRWLKGISKTPLAMKVVRNRVIVAFERAIHVWCGLTGSHLLSE